MNSQTPIGNSTRTATGMVPEANRQADVPNQIEALGSASQRVIEAAKHLSSRLQPILRPIPPQNVGQIAQVPDPTVCEVAAHVRDKVATLHNAADLLESLAREVEL